MAFSVQRQGFGVDVWVSVGVTVWVGVELPVGVTVDVSVSVGVGVSEGVTERVLEGVSEGGGVLERERITNAQSWLSGAVNVRIPPASTTPPSITAPLRGLNHSRLKKLDSPDKSILTEPPAGR